MKNRRIVIVAFMLIAVLVMGIGYSALTDNLFIKGEASLITTSAQSNFDEDVYFSAATVVEKTGSNYVAGTTEDSAVIGSTDNDSATFYVKTLGNKDEYVTFKFTITNNSAEFDASIALDTGYPQTTNSAFTITYSTDADSVVTDNITCAAGGTVDVYVTVTLNNTPSENTTSAFNVNLTATSAPKA